MDWISYCINNMLTASQWTKLKLTNSCVGLIGPIGPTGPEGEGTIGEIGETGPEGLQGNDGPQGGRGGVGVTGPAGPTGPQLLNIEFINLEGLSDPTVSLTSSDIYSTYILQKTTEDSVDIVRFNLPNTVDDDKAFWIMIKNDSIYPIEIRTNAFTTRYNLSYRYIDARPTGGVSPTVILYRETATQVFIL